MRSRRLSDDYANLIFKYCDENPDFTIKQLAKLVKKSKSTVYDVLQRRISRTFIQQKKKLGRPNKTNAGEDDEIIQNLETDRRKTLATLSNNFPVSRFTIRRRIQKAGFRYRKASQFFLTSQQREKRILYANRYLNFDWSRVMFSDEMVVKLKKTRKNSEIYFWRRSSERFETRILIDTQIQRGGNVTVWGCFLFFGFGSIETFYSTINAQHYTEETLPNFLLPSVDMLNPPRRTFVFQQDNATPHTANVTKNYLREKKFHCSNGPHIALI